MANPFPTPVSVEDALVQLAFLEILEGFKKLGKKLTRGQARKLAELVPAFRELELADQEYVIDQVIGAETLTLGALALWIYQRLVYAHEDPLPASIKKAPNVLFNMEGVSQCVATALAVIIERLDLPVLSTRAGVREAVLQAGRLFNQGRFGPAAGIVPPTAPAEWRYYVRFSLAQTSKGRCGYEKCPRERRENRNPYGKRPKFKRF